jgi:hypothetical protein
MKKIGKPSSIRMANATIINIGDVTISITIAKRRLTIYIINYIAKLLKINE